MSKLPEKSKFDKYVKMGLIRSQTKDNLTVYQYTEITQFDRLWNTTTLVARGIVFDSDGELVQRCIPKFFNADEPDGIIALKLNFSDMVKINKKSIFKITVQEKVDGSLIKVTFDDKHGLVVTSKASFETDQAKWAKEIIEEEGYIFEPGYTYHFELIHPDNQIVLNYGDRRELILLAVVINDSGNEIDIYDNNMFNVDTDKPNFKLVNRLENSVIEDVNGLNGDDLKEGIVIKYGNILRLKMKTDEYVRIHRIVTNLTTKRVWEALSEGIKIERQNIPEEFFKWLTDTENKLFNDYQKLSDGIDNAIKETQDYTNKELGLSNNQFKSYIFAHRNNIDIKPMIWKAIKPEGDENV